MNDFTYTCGEGMELSPSEGIKLLVEGVKPLGEGRKPLGEARSH